MAGIPQSEYYRHGGHVDFPGEQSVLHNYRTANHSDGDVVKEKFYGQPADRPPEIKLLLAIFQRALDDLATAGNDARGRLMRNQAARWVLADDDGPFAFFWVCEHLGLDARWIRAGIVQRYWLRF